VFIIGIFTRWNTTNGRTAIAGWGSCTFCWVIVRFWWFYYVSIKSHGHVRIWMRRVMWMRILWMRKMVIIHVRVVDWWYIKRLTMSRRWRS